MRRTEGSISFLDGLTLLLIAFKLARVGQVATWSWVWVLAPLWMSTAVLAGLRIIARIIQKRQAQQQIRESLRRSSR